MVLTVSFVLSSATNSFLSPSLNGLTATSPGWAGFASAQLGISNGCQDHTTSPYAATSTNPSASHVLPAEILAKALKRRSSARRSITHRINLPCDASSRQRCRVHRIPSRVRDNSRSAPLWVGRMGKYFLRVGVGVGGGPEVHWQRAIDRRQGLYVGPVGAQERTGSPRSRNR